MSQERRLSKIYETLSLTERARILLEAYKAGEDYDPMLRWSTAPEQRRELGRLIDQVVATNTHIAWLLTSWDARVRLLEMQRGWYPTSGSGAPGAYYASSYLAFHDLELITESERDRRIADSALTPSPFPGWPNTSWTGRRTTKASRPPGRSEPGRSGRRSGRSGNVSPTGPCGRQKTGTQRKWRWARSTTGSGSRRRSFPSGAHWLRWSPTMNSGGSERSAAAASNFARKPTPR